MSRIRQAGRQLVGLITGLAGDRGETLIMYDSVGYFPNLMWPRSFSEKIVRRKLTRPPALWSDYSDKLLVRDHVAQRVGAGCLTELYLATDDPDEIRFASLPPRFVVKANHGSGWNLIVDGRHHIREDVVRSQCREWLGRRYGAQTHESWYSGIRPRIIVEQYLEDSVHGIPLDYKFWVFHGRVEFVQIDFGRFSNHTRTFYDRDWKRQPWGVSYPAGPDLQRPPTLDRMIEIAERLAVDPDFIRVDLYSPDEAAVFFGELTLAPGAGWEPFWPTKIHDFQVGSLW